MANCRFVCLRQRTYLLPWPSEVWTHYLENLFSSWPDSRKYFRMFWLKSLQLFRSCWVNKISMSIAGWPWPLSRWPSWCRQCHVDLILINCDHFIQKIYRWGNGLTDRCIDGALTDRGTHGHLKMQHVKMTDHHSRAAWKCNTRKWRTK